VVKKQRKFGSALRSAIKKRYFIINPVSNVRILRTEVHKMTEETNIKTKIQVKEKKKVRVSRIHDVFSCFLFFQTSSALKKSVNVSLALFRPFGLAAWFSG